VVQATALAHGRSEGDDTVGDARTDTCNETHRQAGDGRCDDTPDGQQAEWERDDNGDRHRAAATSNAGCDDYDARATASHGSRARNDRSCGDDCPTRRDDGASAPG
jgi:hypothetical protein